MAKGLTEREYNYTFPHMDNDRHPSIPPQDGAPPAPARDAIVVFQPVHAKSVYTTRHGAIPGKTQISFPPHGTIRAHYPVFRLQWRGNVVSCRQLQTNAVLEKGGESRGGVPAMPPRLFSEVYHADVLRR